MTRRITQSRLCFNIPPEKRGRYFLYAIQSPRVGDRMSCTLSPWLMGKPERVEMLVRDVIRDPGPRIVVDLVYEGHRLRRLYRNDPMDRSLYEEYRLVSTRAKWSRYVLHMVDGVWAAVRKHCPLHAVRFCVYPDRLTAAAIEHLKRRPEVSLEWRKGRPARIF